MPPLTPCLLHPASSSHTTKSPLPPPPPPPPPPLSVGSSVYTELLSVKGYDNFKTDILDNLVAKLGKAYIHGILFSEEVRREISVSVLRVS